MVIEGVEDGLILRGSYRDHWILVACDKAGLKHVAGFIKEWSWLKEVLIIADHDTDERLESTGQCLAWQLGESLKSPGIAVEVLMPSVAKDDANAALQAGRLGEWTESLIEIPEQFQIDEDGCRQAKDLPPEKTKSNLVVVSFQDFLKKELSRRSLILSPWLPSQGLTMIFASRGVGKTWISLNCAYAAATGSKFLRWEAPRASGVLFIDGEMPGIVLQERLQLIRQDFGMEPKEPLDFLTPDFQERGIPDLSVEEGQKQVDELLTDKIKLVVLDNLSTLVRSGKENESESWVKIQEWILKLRANGVSVLMIHHSGKSGAQRGTSKREDILDTVIALRRPLDYSPEMGAKFEVHFEKARGLWGDDVKSFSVTMNPEVVGKGGNLESGTPTERWKVEDLTESLRARVIELYNDEWTQADISRELGVNRSTVSKYVRQARAEGKISRGSEGEKKQSEETENEAILSTEREPH